MSTHASAQDAYRLFAQAPAPLSQIGSLHVVLGRQCNVRCEFCYQTSFSPKDDLPAETLRNQLLPFLAYVQKIIIQGGEPTVMKGCRMLRDKLSEVGFSGEVSFVTNGKLFGEDWVNFLIDRPGPSLIHFSVNASNERIYDDVIKYGDFNAVMTNINRLIEARRRSRKPVRIRTSFVIYQKNMWDILDFAKLFVGSGVEEIVYFIDSRTPDAFWKDLDPEELGKFHELVQETISFLRERGADPTELVALDRMLISAQERVYLKEFA